MSVLLFAFAIGVIAGLRALTAPSIISWAARMGYLNVEDTPLAFLGYHWTAWIFSLCAVGELITDKLPSTPSRKIPVQFGTRILMGAMSGAAITAAHGGLVEGAIAGAVGAVAGTLGGAEARGRLVRATGGRDLPIALLEDCVAILGGILIVSGLS